MPFAAHDLRDATRPAIPVARQLHLPGSADLKERREITVAVTYDNPVTDQQVTVDVPVQRDAVRPRQDGPVAVVVDRDDPDRVMVEGDRDPTEQYLLAYGWLPFLPVALWLLRRHRSRRAAALVVADLPSYALLGAVTGPRLSGGRCLLHLYAADSAPGARPLCVVPLASTEGAPLGVALPAEVKGVPRPGGLVVARLDDSVILPTGPALRRRGLPRPEAPEPLTPPPDPALRATHVSPPPAWPLLARWRLPVLVAALALTGITTAVTLVHAHAAPSPAHGDQRVLATITGADSFDVEVHVDYVTGDGQLRKGIAGVDFPEEYTVGRRYPAVVDHDDPTNVVLLAEPYDVVEPIVWASLPLPFALDRAGRWLLWRRRSRRAVPWHPVVACRTDDQVLELLHPVLGLPTCEVLVDGDQLAAVMRRLGYVLLSVAGTAGPGEAVALRCGDVPLGVLGPARAGPREGFLRSLRRTV